MEAVSKDKIYDEDYLTELFLIYSEQQLNEYYIKLFSTGITINDFNSLTELEGKIRWQIDNLNTKIEEARRRMKNFVTFLSCYNDDRAFEYEAMRYDEAQVKESNLSSIVKEFNDIDEKILGIIYETQSILDKKTFSDEIIDYIINNTSLAHLVYANNTHPVIKHRSVASHMFLCQFHNEKTPSFLVHRKRCNCFGCGYNENQIEYLIDFENITEEQAIYLLAEIYMIEMPNNPYKNSELVEKYRKVLTSGEYMNFISTSIERVKTRSGDTQKGIDELKWYEEHLNSIKRIKSEELDENIKDKCTINNKVYKKEMPNFDD